MFIFRNLLLALLCIVLAPATAAAQTSIMYVNVRDMSLYPNGHAVTGPVVCANVLSSEPGSQTAAQHLEQMSVEVRNGQARFRMPQDREYRNLFFEGRVRFVVMDPDHCPMACDIDFYWSYRDEFPGTVPEYSCSLDLANAELGSYACNYGSSPTTSYSQPTYFTPQGGGLPLSTADIDGTVERYIGDTAAHPLVCPGRTIRTPTVPEIVPLNPVVTRPGIPQSPVDPNLVNPGRGPNPIIPRR